MMKRILVLLVLLLSFALAQEATSPDVAADDPVVVRVGDKEETLSNFNDRFEIAIRSLAAQQGIGLTEELRAQLEGFKPQFLQRRSTELLLISEAEARDIGVEEGFVDSQIDEIKASMPEGSSFEDFLANAGFKDEAQFRDYIHETELLQNVVSSLQSDIEVSEEDLTAAYEEQKDQFQTDERVCARHILVETEDAANDLLSQINDGADFAELASANSIDPSGASNGGDLGCFGRGMMVPPFEEAAFTAETDQPVGPVQSQFGYHLILVYDKQEAGTRSFEDVRAELEQSLKQEKFTTMIDALRASATIETFPEALAPVAPATEEVPADDAAPSDDTDTSSSGDTTDNSGDTTDNSDDATNTEENSGE